MSVTSFDSSNQANSVASSSNSKKLFSPKNIMAFAVLQLGGIGASAYFTYQHYVTPTLTNKAIKDKSEHLALQQAQVETLKSQTTAQLSVLAQRMGTLTARMNRIDALGERLAKSADYSEFNFAQLPAIGGPEQYSGVEQSSELSALLMQMDAMVGHLDSQQEQLDLLETVMLNHEIHEDSRISGRPIKRGWMSSLYGMRNDPFNGKLAMHKGVDFAGKDGDDVMATGAGVVTWSGKRYGYGLLVEIDHGAGLKTRYAHAKELKVNVGDVVSKGEIIALMGNTGRSTGAHVHYEVLSKDKQVNPRKYIYR
ncbi:MAG: M23 family metallopeptidase [Psychrobium sp.]